MQQETPARSATPVLDSPKEDGEVGETLGDIVRRHQLDITPGGRAPLQRDAYGLRIYGAGHGIQLRTLAFSNSFSDAPQGDAC